MNDSHNPVMKILQIGHDTSSRGEGLSLSEAIARSNYLDLRKTITQSDLATFLQSSPELITQWIMYSEDKRSRGGWWIKKETIEVGCLELPGSTIRCTTLEEAVAEFVIRELDFWSRLKA